MNDRLSEKHSILFDLGAGRPLCPLLSAVYAPGPYSHEALGYFTDWIVGHNEIVGPVRWATLTLGEWRELAGLP